MFAHTQRRAVHAAVVRDNTRKEVTEVLSDMLHIEMLKAVVAGIVEKNHDEHDFRLRKRPVTVIFALGKGFYGVFFHQTVKKLAEFICHKEKFRNFVPSVPQSS